MSWHSDQQPQVWLVWSIESLASFGHNFFGLAGKRSHPEHRADTLLNHVMWMHCWPVKPSSRQRGWKGRIVVFNYSPERKLLNIWSKKIPRYSRRELMNFKSVTSSCDGCSLQVREHCCISWRAFISMFIVHTSLAFDEFFEHVNLGSYLRNVTNLM